ncbi:hypothetical protein AAE478_008491 [Parahypoxylon ruwenzoriense]
MAEDQGSGDNVNWDEVILQLDFVNVDWREYNFSQVPWETLLDSTIQELVDMHRQYDDIHLPDHSQQTSPAYYELMRRLEATRNKTPTNREAVTEDPMTWVRPTPHTVDDPRDRSDDYSSPTPTAATMAAAAKRKEPPKGMKYRPEDMNPNGFPTWGFELEVPIAVARTGGLYANRPHPDDLRWEAEEIIEVEESSDRPRRVAVERVLQILNSQTEGLVFIRKDEDEDDELYSLKVRNLQGLEEGTGPVVPEGADDLGLHDGKAPDEREERIAQDALEFATLYFNAEEGRYIQMATDDDMQRAAARIPDLSAGWGVITQTEGDRIHARIRDLVQLEVFKAKRDARHVFLPEMKPRYRAFSVYGTDDVNLSNVKQGDYIDQPRDNPKDLYYWEVIKVVSPVMQVKPHEDLDTVSRICRALRQNFRIHRDMPSIPATTQITVSNSGGFNILEIKKIITLIALFGNDLLMKLHRRHRSRPEYETVCGPIKTHSKLGGLSFTEPWAEGFDPEQITPHPSIETRDFLREQMGRFLPIDLILTDEKLPDKIFYIVLWMCTSVDAISKAVNTGHRSRKLEVVTKCQGNWHLTGADPSAPEEVEYPDTELPFTVVDPIRGVFEFRQCSGSLDPEHIVRWALLCSHMVNFAKVAPDENFRTYVNDVLNNRTTVLGGMGVAQDVQDYFQNRLNGEDGYFQLEDPAVSWDDPFYKPMP